ncbi:MAG: replication factor C large subunit [Methanobacteriota archaeon]|nr:MAG: replication factor C large subunit [Euryarchaeota archaeon]
MKDWAEKYRPKTLGEVAGNSQAIGQLRRWAESWSHKIPAKRAVVLAGDPGIGKTSAALALANDFGWIVVEMNASDKRNAQAVRDIALRGAVGETFADDGRFLSAKEGDRKIIILDEADNLFGKEDFGGMGAIADVLRQAKQPIILIANDLYSLTRRSSAIKQRCTIIRFRRPDTSAVIKVLRDIARNEGVKVAEEAIRFVAERNDGDMRSSINDLQSLVEGREEVLADDVESLGYRDRKKDIYKALSDIFRTSSCKKSRESVFQLDESPDYFILWIEHNVPLDYKDPEDLSRAFNALSRADVYLGRVNKLRYYGLWSYATDMMSCGVSMARKGRYSGGRYNFPLWLSKMSRSRGIRNTIKSISKKVGDYCHTSSGVVSRDMFPNFKFLFNSDSDFRFHITERLDLTEREVGFLMGEKEDSAAVRHLIEAIRKMKSKDEEGKEIFQDYEKKDKVRRQKKSQKSLGEY